MTQGVGMGTPWNWEVLQRTAVNNNSENRVAFITDTDLLLSAHHLWLLLIPLPLHVRPIIYPSRSVICAFRSGRTGGRKGHGIEEKRVIGEQSRRSAKQLAGQLAPGNSIWFEFGVGGGGRRRWRGILRFVIAVWLDVATTQAAWRGIAFNNG